jgi:hypothetical protein
MAVVISIWWFVAGANLSRAEVAAAGPAESSAAAPRTGRFRLGAGGFASMVADGTALGGRLAADWLPRQTRGFGLRVSSAYTGSQTGGVGQGQASWSRATAELGPSYSLGHARFDAGAVASLLWIGGEGFKPNQHSSGAAFGMTLGGRAEWPWGRVVPWIEIRGFLWPQSQTISVLDATTGMKTSHDLPHEELQLGGGIALAF